MNELSIHDHGLIYFKTLRTLYPEEPIEKHENMARRYERYVLHRRCLKAIDEKLNEKFGENINSICKNCGATLYDNKYFLSYNEYFLLSHKCPVCNVDPDIRTKNWEEWINKKS